MGGLGSTELGVNCILEPLINSASQAPAARRHGRRHQLSTKRKEVTAVGPTRPATLRRSASIFADYYKQHDKFLEDQRHGYQRSGHRVSRADGYFYICDRKKDMLISGGVNIYPSEIESALESHPDIL